MNIIKWLLGKRPFLVIQKRQGKEEVVAEFWFRCRAVRHARNLQSMPPLMQSQKSYYSVVRREDWNG